MRKRKNNTTARSSYLFFFRLSILTSKSVRVQALQATRRCTGRLRPLSQEKDQSENAAPLVPFHRDRPTFELQLKLFSNYLLSPFDLFSTAPLSFLSRLSSMKWNDFAALQLVRLFLCTTGNLNNEAIFIAHFLARLNQQLPAAIWLEKTKFVGGSWFSKKYQRPLTSFLWWNFQAKSF